MAAILGAFVKYSVTMVLCVCVAAAGIFCGKKWHDKSETKASSAEESDK